MSSKPVASESMPAKIMSAKAMAAIIMMSPEAEDDARRIGVTARIVAPTIIGSSNIAT